MFLELNLKSYSEILFATFGRTVIKSEKIIIFAVSTASNHKNI